MRYLNITNIQCSILLILVRECIPKELQKDRISANCGLKNMRPIFKTNTLFYHLKVNFDVKILFGQVIHFVDPKLKKNREGVLLHYLLSIET